MVYEYVEQRISNLIDKWFAHGKVCTDLVDIDVLKYVREKLGYLMYELNRLPPDLIPQIMYHKVVDADQQTSGFKTKFCYYSIDLLFNIEGNQNKFFNLTIKIFKDGKIEYFVEKWKESKTRLGLSLLVDDDSFRAAEWKSLKSSIYKTLEICDAIHGEFP